MTLSAGTRFGPYEILAPLGAGGMGEVYRARDTRLDRDVAIKILPAHMSESPELRKRFEREAKTISRLSHPHICALHDVGSEGGVDYLVMELLEGETLGTRLAKGSLSPDHTCRYGAEIAEALGVAHAAGVVHRDLKPGNVMVTKAGVKLLDFGLARPAIVGQEGGSAVDTMSGPLTRDGAVFGTLPYMAPEQLQGKEADARTDIFALGATLYEMATGRRAFAGQTPTLIGSAILRDEPPPMAEIAPMAPPALDRLVRRCLAKDPEERWQSARDVAAELRFLRNEILTPARAPAAVRAPRAAIGRALPWAIAALPLAAAAWLALRRPETKSAGVLQLSFPTPPLALGAHPVSPAAVLSPDGRRVVFVGATAGERQLFVRDLDASQARPMAGTEGAISPFFSPDGLMVGFAAEGSLKKIPVSGGTPETIARAADVVHGGSWCTDGTIVFEIKRTLWSVPASGGEPKAVTHLEEPEQRHYFPEFLPGCRAILYSVLHEGSAPISIVAQSLEGGRPARLVEGGSNARFAAPGALLYVVKGSLFAAPFDPGRLSLTGPARKVIDGIAYGAPLERALGQFSVSAQGTLAYIPGISYAGAKSELIWVGRDGVVAPIAEVGSVAGIRLSPDGRRIAFAEETDGQMQIWTYDVERGVRSRVTFGGMNYWPGWTPDGRRLLFTHSDDGKTYRLSWQHADGTGAFEAFAAPGHVQNAGGCTPDGNTLLANDFEYPPSSGTIHLDIVGIPRDGGRQPKPLLAAVFNQYLPFLSSDGRWLAYVSEESGRSEIYVRPYPALDAKYPVSSGGGNEPVWAPSGRELFYRDGPRFMAVDIAPGNVFRAGKPRLLFEVEALGVGARHGRFYDISPDGRRFVTVRSSYTIAADQVNVVLDWPALLKKSTPAR